VSALRGLYALLNEDNVLFLPVRKRIYSRHHIYRNVYLPANDNSRGMYFSFDGFCSVCYNDKLK
jgi:hypothetical protein